MKILEPFFKVLLHNWPGLACLLVIYILFKILASPTFKGWFGEKMVLRGLRKLDPAQYRVFHDLYLPHPSEEGTTQIDHVVVSPFGIFVIETKNYRGWIFGSKKQLQWTQQIYRQKHKFQNPCIRTNSTSKPSCNSLICQKIIFILPCFLWATPSSKPRCRIMS